MLRVQHRQDEAGLTISGRRDTPFRTTPAKASSQSSAGNVRLELARSSEGVQAPNHAKCQSGQPATTLRTRPDTHSYPDLSTFAALTGRDAQLALCEVSRPHHQPYHKFNRINDLRGLNADFPAVTVTTRSNSRSFGEERQSLCSIETKSCRQLTFAVGLSLADSPVL